MKAPVDTNRAGFWWCVRLTAGVLILAAAVLIRTNTHEGNCHQTPEGRQCSVLWGKQ